MKSLGNHVYRVGNIDIDESRGCLRRAGKEQYLRPKAFQLLLFLLERRHRLVSKDELIEGIWGTTAVTDDALVQVIREVRRVLGDDPRQPQFIKTIPKMGYRFIGPAEEYFAGGGATVETREITTVEIEYEREVAEHIESAKAAVLPAVAANRRIRQRILIAGALAGVMILAFSVLAFVGLQRGNSSRDVVLSAAPGKKPIAVMYFENQSGA